MEETHKADRLKIWEILLLGVAGVAVVAIGVAIAVFWMKNPPKPPRRPPVDSAQLVEVLPVELTREQAVIEVFGNVIPAREVDLVPRVSGEVVACHPAWYEGGIVKKGDLVIQLDDSDYRLNLVTQEAQLESAKYQLRIEEGQQDVAAREWEILGMQDKASDLDRELALRQPHLREKKAQLLAAEAAVEQAELNLARTKIRAPFNAIILSADVETGDQAGTQTKLGHLVGTDTYWVQLSIATDELQWIDLPASGSGSSTQARVYGTAGCVRMGQVLALLGDLEPQGRLARLLVEVEDPLDLKTESGQREPLVLGEYTRAELLGRFMEDVAAVPATALRDGRNAWIKTPEGKLVIREVEMVWRDENRVMLKGLQEGEELVISEIPAPVEGMELALPGELLPDAEEDGADASPEAGDAETQDGEKN